MVVMNPKRSWKPLIVAIGGFILVFVGSVVVDMAQESQIPAFSN